MTLLLISIVLLLVSGVVALLLSRSFRWSTWVGVSGAVAGCVLGLIPAFQVLLTGSREVVRLAWNLPYGSFFVQLDALSAFFLLPILFLSALAAIYGSEYLAAYREKKLMGPAWFFFNWLVASMMMVVIAYNALLFLVAWEMMALLSFFLVAFEHEKPSVREASWTYLIASQLGSAFLIVMFLLLGREAGSLDFDRFTGTGRITELAGVLFVLALIGFGTKAGFMPFHVWLPEAHPAAPSHVSALMSGVMIKTGIYAIIRTLEFLGAPPLWWGLVLIGIGLVSGIVGILFALAQRDLKGLLAYCSVENIGIITLGLGAGVVGIAMHSPVLAILGMAGCLLHIVNHALFKGLLFLGAGAVLHSTHTRDMDHLGGLLKRMPITGATFLIAAIAISGIPPLNGFVSEFLIYLGACNGLSLDTSTVVALLAVVAGLALIGGLATACFTKAFGIVFLGAARSEHAEHAHEVGPWMTIPLMILALCCIMIGLGSVVVIPALDHVVGSVTKIPMTVVTRELLAATNILWAITCVFMALVGFIVLFTLLRRFLLAGRKVEQAMTWDCGYVRPTARMEYTSSSFAQPLVQVFRALLRTRKKLASPHGFFPQGASFSTNTPDIARTVIFAPLFKSVEKGLSWLRWLQHGRVHLYVFYIVITLLLLLLWELK